MGAPKSSPSPGVTSISFPGRDSSNISFREYDFSVFFAPLSVWIRFLGTSWRVPLVQPSRLSHAQQVKRYQGMLASTLACSKYGVSSCERTLVHQSA